MSYIPGHTYENIEYSINVFLDKVNLGVFRIFRTSAFMHINCIDIFSTFLLMHLKKRRMNKNVFFDHCLISAERVQKRISNMSG